MLVTSVAWVTGMYGVYGGGVQGRYTCLHRSNTVFTVLNGQNRLFYVYAPFYRTVIHTVYTLSHRFTPFSLFTARVIVAARVNVTAQTPLPHCYTVTAPLHLSHRLRLLRLLRL